MPAARPILATLHRPDGQSTKVLWNRRYSRLARAVPRAVEICLIDGQPLDRIEFSHAEYGFQIAVVTMHVGGNIDFKVSTDLEEHNAL